MRVTRKQNKIDLVSILLYKVYRENFKTASGQLSDRLKIFAGQKKKMSDRKNDQEKKKKKKKIELRKLVVFHE